MKNWSSFCYLFWRVRSNILKPNGSIFCLNKKRNIAQVFTTSIKKFLPVFNQGHSQRQLLLFKMLKLVRIFSMQKGKIIKLIVEVLSQAFLPQWASNTERVNSQISCEVHSWIIYKQEWGHCNLMAKEI